jgi:hypothetical protein
MDIFFLMFSNPSCRDEEDVVVTVPTWDDDEATERWDDRSDLCDRTVEADDRWDLRDASDTLPVVVMVLSSKSKYDANLLLML